MLEKEFAFFKSNMNDLIEKYPDKVLLISGTDIVGVYEDYLNAVIEADKNYPPGSIMIQKCDTNPNAYPVRVASAVPVFA